MKLGLTTKWKAIIALIGTVGTAIVAVGVDPDVVKALGEQSATSGWSAAIIAAGGIVTGWATYAKKNTPTFESVDAALESLPVEDLKAILAKWDSKP
jgi:hypothetical protein